MLLAALEQRSERELCFRIFKAAEKIRRSGQYRTYAGILSFVHLLLCQASHFSDLLVRPFHECLTHVCHSPCLLFSSPKHDWSRRKSSRGLLEMRQAAKQPRPQLHEKSRGSGLVPCTPVRMKATKTRVLALLRVLLQGPLKGFFDLRA